MRRIQIFIVSIFFTVSLSWFSSISGKVTEPTAPLLTRMGTHHHSIATKSPKAQGYFDQGLDLAYAEAMEKVTQQDPDDMDAATIYAEALMNTMPWDYWTEKGKPKPEAQKVLDTLAGL